MSVEKLPVQDREQPRAQIALARLSAQRLIARSRVDCTRSSALLTLRVRDTARSAAAWG
jgi:hypothetical protein